MAAGSKKYVAARVATTRTAWPRRFKSAKSSGVFTAATEPVTPSRTLAMAALRNDALDGADEFGRELVPFDAHVSAVLRPDVGPIAGRFERVGDHQLGVRLSPR